MSIKEPVQTQDTPFEAEPGALPERPFGRQGEMLPVLGLGGQSLIQRSDSDEAATGLISRALDLGVRYIDTAPLYGPSEVRIGKAIEHRRSEVFLATKTAYRMASAAERSLERSLKRLRTDYIDCFQLHCFMDRSEIGFIFGRFGVMKMLERAREAGTIRRLGVTGHYDPSILSELIRRYPFDSVLCPVNVADPERLSFISDTLEAASETGTSVVAMKVMGAGLLTSRGLKPDVLLRYALSQKVSVALVSCRSVRDLEENVAAARAFVPMSTDEMRAAEAAPPDALQDCNAIYKRVPGWRSLRLRARNRALAEVAKWLPGFWHC